MPTSQRKGNGLERQKEIISDSPFNSMRFLDLEIDALFQKPYENIDYRKVTPSRYMRLDTLDIICIGRAENLHFEVLQITSVPQVLSPREKLNSTIREILYAYDPQFHDRIAGTDTEPTLTAKQALDAIIMVVIDDTMGTLDSPKDYIEYGKGK